MISSCTLSDTFPKDIVKDIVGMYQGSMTMTNGNHITSPYTLNIVADETGSYLGTLTNINANEQTIMHCSYGKQIFVIECVAINIFKSQVFKLYGSTTHMKYQGNFEYFEKGIKEFEGDFTLDKN